MKQLLLSCFLMVTSLVIAQTSTKDYESLTYRLYSEKKWDSLLICGKEALNQGYDYFYMRSRIGTASYYLRKYSLAAHHFERARKLNQNNDFVNELLLYTYLFLGKNSNAQILTRQITYGDSLFRDYIPPIFYIESGLTNNTTANLDHKKNKIAPIYKYKEYINDVSSFYLTTGWQQPMSARLSLHAAFTYNKLSKERTITVRELDSLYGPFTVKQSEMYVAPTIALTTRMNFTPALKYAETAITEPFNITDSLIKIYSGGQISSNYKNYVAGGDLNYFLNYINFNCGAWWLNLNDISTFQVSGSFTVFPLGNTDLYCTSKTSYKSNRTDIIFTQLVGVRLYHYSWLEMSFTGGNLAETVENNGYVLNNEVSESNYRITSLIIADVIKNLRLTLRYQYLNNNGTLFFTDTHNKLFKENFIYSNHIITGGLTWRIN